MAWAAAAFLVHGLAVLAGPIELPGMHPEPDVGLLWNKLLTLRAAGGYKQNAILSAFNPQDTPILGGGLEWFASRLPVDGHGLTLFLSADERRYIDPVEVSSAADPIRGERTILSQASYKWYGTTWVPTMAMTYLHAEQAFDATELASDPGFIREIGRAHV